MKYYTNLDLTVKTVRENRLSLNYEFITEMIVRELFWEDPAQFKETEVFVYLLSDDSEELGCWIVEADYEPTFSSMKCDTIQVLK